MHASLRRHSEATVICDGFGFPRSFRARLENWLLGLLNEKPFYRLGSARHYAARFRERIEALDDEWDVLLCIDSLVTIASLDLDRPIVYVSDCNKSQLVELGYPGFDQLSPSALKRLRCVERQAYERADLLVFPSQWAATSTVERYGVSPDKVKVVPFGANLDGPPRPELPYERASWRPSNRCELLFLGVAWERKGGDFAIEIIEALNQKGLHTRLTVCGTVPPHPASETLRIVPFLDKNDPQDLALLKSLLLDASYLVLPTRAECSPIVLCEAFAYGLPPISRRVGGVPEMIEHGISGFCLDLGASPKDHADLIFEHYQNPDAYLQTRRACREQYEQTFNWDHWAQKVFELTHDLDCSHR